MVGSWEGTFGGTQTVEETWAPAMHGSMATMIKLSNADGIQMIELIVIREDNDTLMLHLRQFSPALELRLAQEFKLDKLDGQSVSFVPAEPSNPSEPPIKDVVIQKLTYTQAKAGHLQVDVMIDNDTIFTAFLVAA